MPKDQTNVHKQNMNSFVANFEMNYVVDIVDVLKFNFAPYKKICLHRKSVNNIANCDIQTCTRIKSSVYYSRIQNGTWIKHWVHPNVLLSHAQHMHALSENIHKFLKLWNNHVIMFYLNIKQSASFVSTAISNLIWFWLNS